MFGFFRDPHDVIAERNRHEEKMARLGAHPLQWFSKVTRPAGETRWESRPVVTDEQIRAIVDRAVKMHTRPQRPPAMRSEEV